MQKSWEKNFVLARLFHYISIIQRGTFLKTFIESQLSYCPLVWIFQSRTLSNKINHLHERAI